MELFELQPPPKPRPAGKGKAPDCPISVSVPVPRTFQTLRELLEHQLAAARADLAAASPKRAACRDAEPLLRALERHAAGLVARVPKRALRSALVHDDLHEGNILVDEATGVVTGIVDWECHSVAPRCLAARYPHWLRYDGVHDPRFAVPGTFWLETAHESARLNSLFERVRVLIRGLEHQY